MPKKSFDPLAMENCVCFNLRRTARKVTQFYDAAMRRHGIRPTQGTILATLSAKNTWTMAELSEWLGMERTTLVRNLRPLQRDGLVTTQGGGRGKLVEVILTPDGREQMEAVLPAWREAQQAMMGTLGEDRWSSVLKDLETATVVLSS